MWGFGHAKEGLETGTSNYSMAYGTSNRGLLSYEPYPGSIVDVSQLQSALKEAKGCGHEHVGFILDRGYFCRENIQYMDEDGHQFVIMAKGKKDLVIGLILKGQGAFDNESTDARIFIGSAAAMIRSRIYTLPKDETGRMDKKQDYMTAPAAIKGPEKIGLICRAL